MKLYTFLFSVLFAISAIAQSNLNWTTLNTGTTKNINDLYFTSPDTGYIVGDNYLFKKTTDGGASWTNLTPPTNGERANNNGNIIAIGYHAPNFGSIDSSLILSWQNPFHGNITADDGNSYTTFPYNDSNKFCSLNGFGTFSANPGNGYLHLISYGASCVGNAMLLDYYDGPFSLQFTDSSVTTKAGSFVDADADSNAIIMGHSSGYLLRYEPIFTLTDSIYLDSSGISAVAYAGNNKWYASTNSNYYNLYVSTDSGKTFKVDSTLPPTFFYPKLNDFSFSNNFGIAGATSNFSYGSIIVKNGNQWDFYYAQQPINKVKVFDNGVAYAVGDSGLVMKTTIVTSLDQIAPSSAELKVYPNPAHDFISISGLEDHSIASIQLFEINGRLVSSYSASTKTFDLSAIAKGIYVLKVRTDKANYSTKVIVK